MSGTLKKASMEARLQEAERRMDDIIDSANNPFTGASFIFPLSFGSC